MPNSTSSPFHITVGTSPSGGLDLTRELGLLKAAMLYADKVKFCSLTSSMLIMILQLERLSADEMVEVFAQAVKNDALMSAIQMYRYLKRKKHRNSKELIAFKRMQGILRDASKPAQLYFKELSEKSGIQPLVVALNTGFVEIELYDNTDPKEMSKKFFDTVGEAVVSGNTYPLFDDETGKLVNYAIKEGQITAAQPSLIRAKQTGLSSDLLNRLPLFDEATIDEILEIRREL